MKDSFYDFIEVDGPFGKIGIHPHSLHRVLIVRDTPFKYRELAFPYLQAPAYLSGEGGWKIGPLHTYIDKMSIHGTSLFPITPKLRKEFKGILRDIVEQWWIAQGAQSFRDEYEERCAALRKRIVSIEAKIKKENIALSSSKEDNI